MVTAENPESRRDNLSVMRSLVGEIVTELKGRYAQYLSDDVILEVDSSTPAWLVRTEFASALSGEGRRVLTAGVPGPDRTLLAVRGIRLEVTYSNIRKPGVFSDAVLDREVRAEFTTELSGPTEIFGSLRTSRVSRDTVEEEEIVSLENSGMDFTRGRVPDLDSWDRFIEPFVIIGAAGTAIFLFFQVRS